MTAVSIWKLLIEIPWAVFVVYWVFASLKTRSNRVTESSLSRLAIVLVEIAGYALLFSSQMDLGFLATRVLPRTIPGAVLGVAFTWSGIGLALWARFHLAENWSARITIKQNHELIRTGPYRRLRHPIYSGLILAAVGSCLVIDHWRCIAGLLLISGGYIVKARKEEQMLEGQFGAGFVEHRKRTGFLFPRFL